LAVPILRQGDVLIGSIQAALTDAEMLSFQTELSERVGAHRSRGVVVDVTGLDVIDSFSARTLQGIAQTVKLRGAHTVIVGIQPEVAFAMVQLGLLLDGVSTALDLDEGMARLKGLIGTS